ncbi:MAG: MFS transporter [Hyphomonadaceae bacterium]
MANAADAVSQSAQRFSPARAWYAVGMFVLLYCISFVDRYVLALLAAPISESLQISDSSIGILFGLGFGVVYALTGLPLAHLIDRGKRVPLVVGGVVLWSISTILSGYSSNFTELLLCRSGVAIGEAVLSPAAISIIGDLFPREKRVFPTSVYTATSVYMTGGAFVLGGLAMDLATHLQASLGQEPWRLTLIFVGLPGLVLAPILWLTVREPARTQEAVGAADFSSPKQALDYFWRERAVFGWMFVGMSALGICSTGFVAWTPTLLIRAFEQTPAEAGYLFGTIGVVCATIGAFAWPILIKFWSAAGQRDAIVILLAVGLGSILAAIAVLGVAPSLPVALGAIAVAMFAVSSSGILPPNVIQAVAPARMRGRLIAINLMASTLVGLAVGPTLCAFVAETFYSGPRALGYAMTSVAAFSGPTAVIAILLMRKRFLIALDEAIAREAAAANAEAQPAGTPAAAT